MGDETRPLKIREAADRLGVDYGAIRGAIEQGLLKAESLDGSFRILPEDLEDYRVRAASRPPAPRIEEQPAPLTPESPEEEAARLFAVRVRRWTKAPGGGGRQP